MAHLKTNRLALAERFKVNADEYAWRSQLVDDEGRVLESEYIASIDPAAPKKTITITRRIMSWGEYIITDKGRLPVPEFNKLKQFKLI